MTTAMKKKKFGAAREFESHEAAWHHQCLAYMVSDELVVMVERPRTCRLPRWVVRPASSAAERRDAKLTREIVRSALAARAARRAQGVTGAR